MRVNIDKIGISLFAWAVDKYNIGGRIAQKDDAGKQPRAPAEICQGNIPDLVMLIWTRRFV